MYPVRGKFSVCAYEYDTQLDAVKFGDLTGSHMYIETLFKMILLIEILRVNCLLFYYRIKNGKV